MSKVKINEDYYDREDYKAAIDLSAMRITVLILSSINENCSNDEVRCRINGALRGIVRAVVEGMVEDGGITA